MSATRILFLGNSITRHAPAPDIGWLGDWGMAASAPEKDYAHVLTARLTDVLGPMEPSYINIATFERTYDTCDMAAYFKPHLEFKADIVIIAIAENVPPLDTPEKHAAYRSSLERLLAMLIAASNPRILVRGGFGGQEPKAAAMREAIGDRDIPFVSAKALGLAPVNTAGAERKIEHGGVAWHPGDRGMAAIADLLYQVIVRK